MNALAGFERHGAAPAVLLPGGEVHSHQALAQGADACTRDLLASDLAAVECDNSLPSLQAYLGCLRARIPVALIDAGLNAALRAALYARFEVSVVHGPGGSGWQRLRPRGPTCHPDLALLLSTSGSTGSPKLVRLSLANLTANATSIASYLALDSSSRAITSLPQQYSYGLSVIHSHLLAGGSLALTAASVAERGFWDHFRDSQANSLAGVPTMYDMLRRLRLERMNLPHLRTLTQAGGRMPVPLVSWLAGLAAERGWRFYVMYGQTEASARMAYLAPEEVADHPGSVGRAIPGGQFHLEDDSGHVIVGNGQPGRLVYSGPNVMLGYAESVAQLALGDVQQGRLLTGDLAQRDDDGRFTITGRTSRFLKVFGNRVGLDDVEALLASQGLQVCATGRDDQIVLAATDGQALDAAAQVVITTLRIHKSAVATLHLASLPTSSAGKVLYADILNTFDTTRTAA
jgi:long-chain acyl-CoA synthetase